VKKSFIKQVTPLLISLLIVGGLTLMLRKFEEEAPRPFDRLIVEVLPEIPDLSGRPAALLERLEVAHGKLEDRRTQREALVDLAYLYHANGFLSQAESCYLGLESFETENARWPYLLGVLKRDRQDKAAVATHFARAIQLDPTNSLAYLRLGHAYQKGGRLKEAKTSYEYRLLGSPKDAWARLGLGQIAILEEEWAAARDWLEQAIEAMPELGPVYELLPEVYLELGEVALAKTIRGAAAEYELVYDLKDVYSSFLPDFSYEPYRLLEFAKLARIEGDVERALELLKRSVELDLGNSDAAAELGRLLAEIEKEAAQ